MKFFLKNTYKGAHYSLQLRNSPAEVFCKKDVLKSCAEFKIAGGVSL